MLTLLSPLHDDTDFSSSESSSLSASGASSRNFVISASTRTVRRPPTCVESTRLSKRPRLRFVGFSFRALSNTNLWCPSAYFIIFVLTTPYPRKTFGFHHFLDHTSKCTCSNEILSNLKLSSQRGPTNQKQIYKYCICQAKVNQTKKHNLCFPRKKATATTENSSYWLFSRLSVLRTFDNRARDVFKT